MYKLLQEFRDLIENEYNEDVSSKNKLIEYHGCLKQFLESKPSEQLLKDISSYQIDLRYEPNNNEDSYYELGTATIFLVDDHDDYLDFHYEITFGIDERNWGYCECTPESDGYDARYDCCGNGCDATFPTINIEKTTNIGFYKYQGSERELWKYRDEWHGVTVDIEQQRKDAQKQRIQDDIDRLKKQLAEFK